MSEADYDNGYNEGYTNGQNDKETTMENKIETLKSIIEKLLGDARFVLDEIEGEL